MIFAEWVETIHPCKRFSHQSDELIDSYPPWDILNPVILINIISLECFCWSQVLKVKASMNVKEFAFLISWVLFSLSIKRELCGLEKLKETSELRSSFGLFDCDPFRSFVRNDYRCDRDIRWRGTKIDGTPPYSPHWSYAMVIWGSGR